MGEQGHLCLSPLLEPPAEEKAYFSDLEKIPKQSGTWGAWPPEVLGALGVSGSRFSVVRGSRLGEESPFSESPHNNFL